MFKEQQKCPKCGSTNVFRAFNSIGNICLFCIDCYVNSIESFLGSKSQMNETYILPPYYPEEKEIRIAGL